MEAPRRIARLISRCEILLAASACLAASGCFLGATELYPLMAKGAEYASGGIIQTAANVTKLADGASSDDTTGAGGRCGGLRSATPGVIELRIGANGGPEYRELRPIDSAHTVTWDPVVDDDTFSDGWRPAVNFLRMDFNPPLEPSIPPAASIYLAYAPQHDESWSQQGRRASLASYFGSPTGTFVWNDHPYEYVLTTRLPCFELSN